MIVVGIVEIDVLLDSIVVGGGCLFVGALGLVLGLVGRVVPCVGCCWWSSCLGWSSWSCCGSGCQW
jgi:hypothetical protein